MTGPRAPAQCSLWLLPAVPVRAIGRTALLHLAWLCCFAAVSSTAARAQDDPRSEVDAPGLGIEASLGWDGAVDLEVPVPISFLISNHSEQPIEGRFVIRDLIGNHTITLDDVYIAPSAARSVRSIQNMTGWSECVATFESGERILWRRELALFSNRTFSVGLNVALFVDDAGRALLLPGGVKRQDPVAVPGTALFATDPAAPAGGGQPVKCLTAKTWEMPDHPGPLQPVQAVIFPENAPSDDLNEAQWRALARWMCTGGLVFVHAQSREIIEGLIKHALLPPDPPVTSGEFTVRAAGLGGIYAYPDSLFSTRFGEITGPMETLIAHRRKQLMCQLMDRTNAFRRSGSQSERNRTVVLAFFGFYAFLTGVVPLLMFRVSRQRVALYSLVIVAGASVLAGLLGGFLRFSRGDLRWMTVTQPGAGGAVQFATIQVQSAGGRNTQAGVKGDHADLQYMGPARPYYINNTLEFTPFTWQPDLSPADDGTYAVRVPMTPWGVRVLHASAFRNDLERLDLKLQFTPSNAQSVRNPDGSPQPGRVMGRCSLKLVNRLPFELKECRIMIGIPQRAGDVTTEYETSTRFGVGTIVQVDPDDDWLIATYEVRQLPNLAAGAELEDEFDATFSVLPNDWEPGPDWQYGRLSPPGMATVDTPTAWFIARIERSPMLEIDERFTDFVPQAQQHYLLQEILPEDLPPELSQGLLDAPTSNPTD